MYHDVVSDEHPLSGFQKTGAIQYTLDSIEFERQIRFIAEKSERRGVLLTFDDGGASFHSVIADILDRYKLKGVFFISTEYIDTPGFLTTVQIRDLLRRGHLIGAHSHSHPRSISRLPKAEIDREWLRSKTILGQITGQSIEIASIPGGAVSDDVLQSLADTGYRTVYTSRPTTRCVERYGLSVLGRYTIDQSTRCDRLSKIIDCPLYRRQLAGKYFARQIAKKLLGKRYNDLKQSLLKITYKNK